MININNYIVEKLKINKNTVTNDYIKTVQDIITYFFGEKEKHLYDDDMEKWLSNTDDKVKVIPYLDIEYERYEKTVLDLLKNIEHEDTIQNIREIDNYITDNKYDYHYTTLSYSSGDRYGNDTHKITINISSNIFVVSIKCPKYMFSIYFFNEKDK